MYQQANDIDDATVPPQDFSKPDKARRHQLDRELYVNRRQGKPPCSGIGINTIGELLWILRQKFWRGGLISDAPPSLIRINRANTAMMQKYGGFVTPADLRGADFEGVNLSFMDFSGALLRNANFNHARLHKCNLTGTDLRGADLSLADLSEVALIEPTQEAYFLELTESGEALEPARSIRVNTRNELLWLQLNGVDQRLLNLHDADVFDADLEGLDLDQVTLIDAGRVRELEGLIAERIEKHRPPLEGVKVTGRQELFWMKYRFHWNGSVSAERSDRINLEGAYCSGGKFLGAALCKANLRRTAFDNTDLSESQLTGADLFRVNLVGARLRGANLVGARICYGEVDGADLSGSNLLGVNLQSASLVGAVLYGARASVADLRGADCRNANLQHTDLRGAKLDAATSLIDVNIDESTWLGDIVWYGIPLLQVKWDQAPELGDEIELEITADQHRTDVRKKAYRDVIRAYHDLAGKLRAQGYTGAYKVYRLRGKKLERQRAFEEFRWLGWSLQLISYTLTGYGLQAWKLLRAYAGVVFAFGVVYFLIIHGLFPCVPRPNRYDVSFPQAVLISLSTFKGQSDIPKSVLAQDTVGPVLFTLNAIETWVGWLVLVGTTILWARRLGGNT